MTLLENLYYRYKNKLDKGKSTLSSLLYVVRVTIYNIIKNYKKKID
jgi:hypothetical protein